jgi:hypothetical protein
VISVRKVVRREIVLLSFIRDQRVAILGLCTHTRLGQQSTAHTAAAAASCAADRAAASLRWRSDSWCRSTDRCSACCNSSA